MINLMNRKEGKNYKREIKMKTKMRKLNKKRD